jgi:hypothetical protein
VDLISLKKHDAEKDLKHIKELLAEGLPTEIKERAALVRQRVEEMILFYDQQLNAAKSELLNSGDKKD